MSNAATFMDELVNLTRRMRTVFDNMVREHGLTLARARILHKLGTDSCGATQRALADELEVEGPTLVRLLDHLESQNSIERHTVEGDRRAKRIVLTAEGRKQAEEVEEVIGQFRDKIMGGITDEELAIALKVINQLSHNMELETR